MADNNMNNQNQSNQDLETSTGRRINKDDALIIDGDISETPV